MVYRFKLTLRMIRGRDKGPNFASVHVTEA